MRKHQPTPVGSIHGCGPSCKVKAITSEDVAVLGVQTDRPSSFPQAHACVELHQDATHGPNVLGHRCLAKLGHEISDSPQNLTGEYEAVLGKMFFARCPGPPAAKKETPGGHL